MCQHCEDYKAFNFDDNKKRPPIISDDLTAAVLLLLWDDNTTGMMNIIRREWNSKVTFNQKAMADLMAQIAKNQAQAANIGQQRANGNGTVFDQGDIDFGKTIALEQQQYIQGLLDDVMAGRYGPFDKGFDSPEVQAKTKQLEQRLRLHSNRLVGTANEAFVLALPDDMQVWWVLSDDEKHCPDCPEIADASPYTKATLKRFPKDGSTQCGTNCLCYLVTAAGKKSFIPLSVAQTQLTGAQQ